MGTLWLFIYACEGGTTSRIEDDAKQGHGVQATSKITKNKKFHNVSYSHRRFTGYRNDLKDPSIVIVSIVCNNTSGGRIDGCTLLIPTGDTLRLHNTAFRWKCLLLALLADTANHVAVCTWRQKSIFIITCEKNEDGCKSVSPQKERAGST